MKTGRDFFDALSATEQEQFKANFLSCGNRNKEVFLDYLRDEYNSMWNFISGAFIWCEKPEGNNYWARISAREL
jgi:hypothetical protein